MNRTQVDSPFPKYPLAGYSAFWVIDLKQVSCCSLHVFSKSVTHKLLKSEIAKQELNNGNLYISYSFLPQGGVVVGFLLFVDFIIFLLSIRKKSHYV